MGIKNARAHYDAPETPYVLVALFGSLYLWLVAIFYNPDLVILVLAAIFTGLSLALSVMSGVTNTLVLPTKVFPKVKIIAVSLLTLLLLGSVSAGYLYIQKYRALAYAKEGSPENFEKAVSVDRLSVYYRSLANAYLSRTSSDQEDFPELYAKALAVAQKSVEIDSSNYANWLALGAIYGLAGELGVEGAYEQALSAFLKAQELNPTSPTIPLALARLYFGAGKQTEAVQYLNQTISLKPNYTPAYLLAANVARESGDKETARTALELGLSASPGDQDLLTALDGLDEE